MPMPPRLPAKKKHALQPFDRYFFIVVLIITTFGLLAFVSASLGILASNASKFYSVLFSQIVLGFVGGGVALLLAARIPYLFWKRHALWIFIATLLLTALVFLPHIGFSHGGARRWIGLGAVSLQPAELLKLGFVMYFAGWLAWVRKKEGEFKYKILPLLCMLGVIALLLLRQPDTKSLILLTLSGIAMLFVSGISWKKILIVFAAGVIAIATIAFFRPYVMQRIKTFMHPAHDRRGSSYQLDQSLIAIGSGGVFGRGLGQSVQKFNYLPEPQGDSIFAVIGEETGFIGGTALVILYVFLSIRGYKIALGARDEFGRYLVVGLVTLLVAQSFLNIASLVGLFPLTGVPLVFVSQGGTSLAIALAAAGIILNVSRYQKA